MKSKIDVFAKIPEYTKQERFEAYMKESHEEVCKMLVNCNEALSKPKDSTVCTNSIAPDNKYILIKEELEYAYEGVILKISAEVSDIKEREEETRKYLQKQITKIVEEGLNVSGNLIYYKDK